MKKLSAAALAVSLALLLCGCAVTSFGSYEDRGFTAAVGVVSAGDADEIEIHWVTGSIVIEEADVREITFFETDANGKKTDALGEAAKNKELSESLRMRYKSSDGKLEIRFCKSDLRVRSGAVENLNKRLTVRVPTGTSLRAVEIDAVSSDVSATGISSEKIQLNGVSAALELKGCTVRDLDCETVSGNISVVSASVIDDITVNSVSGEINVEMPGIVRLDADCVSAGLSLVLSEADFTLDLEGLSADVAADGVEYTKISDKSYKFGKGTGEARVESVSGKIRVAVK